jgi:transposase
MAKTILDDELWSLIEPILPKAKPRRFRHPGRKPVGNREALTGILFVLKTGIPWEYLPQEMGCGCGMTCWRRLRDWQKAGVWEELHQLLLARLNGADKIDWSHAVIDSASVRAVFGGHTPVPIPRIAARKARNTTSSPMATVSPWPRKPRGRTGMTLPNCCLS